MTESRRYVSQRRALQSAQTRADIVAAAARRFVERGWKATTVAAVAAAAGVAVDTVYASVGGKAALLAAAKDAAKDTGEAMFERPEYRQLGEGPRERRLALAARLIAEVNERTAGLDAVWREAAAGDPAIAAQLSEREEGRRADLAYGLTLVLGDRPDDTTLDGLWAITAPDAYAKLTGRGWSRTGYQEWLAGTMDRLTRPGPRAELRSGRTR
jgi:AcrR family transcriptional regulator